MKKASLFLVLILLSGNLFAQQDVETADTMRSNGKIFVVVAVIAVVLTGLLLYLFNLDRKLSQLEKVIKK
ncbi:MAG: CcmD family protein [Siphonobacter sp.]